MAQSERSIRLELDRSLKSEEQILAEWEQRIERKRETVNRIKAQRTILEKKPSQIGDAPASGPALVKTGDKDKVPGLMELIRAVLESGKEGTHRGRNQTFGRERRRETTRPNLTEKPVSTPLQTIE